jgi:hypothetical protein
MTATTRVKQSPRRSEARLSFMLGRQALACWNFRLARLQQLAGVASPDERELLVIEARLGMQQMASLAERMQTFSRSTIVSVRFEAQEMLAAVARIEAQLSQVQRQLTRQAPVRPAGEIAATLLGRARRGSRSQAARAAS